MGGGWGGGFGGKWEARGRLHHPIGLFGVAMSPRSSAETNSKFYYSNIWYQNDRIFD